MSNDFSLIDLDQILFSVLIMHFFYFFYLYLFVFFIFMEGTVMSSSFLVGRGVLDKTLCEQLFRPIGLLVSSKAQ